MFNSPPISANKKQATPEKSLEELMKCPLTSQKVVADKWKTIRMLGEWVTWWHCSACQSWHVLSTEPDE